MSINRRSYTISQLSIKIILIFHLKDHVFLLHTEHSVDLGLDLSILILTKLLLISWICETKSCVAGMHRACYEHHSVAQILDSNLLHASDPIHGIIIRSFHISHVSICR